MALYRIKPGFDPATASQPTWNGSGMDYLLTSVFEIQDGRSWHKYLVTRDRNGTTWYRRLDWIEPAGNDIDLTVLGDEI